MYLTTRFVTWERTVRRPSRVVFRFRRRRSGDVETRDATQWESTTPAPSTTYPIGRERFRTGSMVVRDRSFVRDNPRETFSRRRVCFYGLVERFRTRAGPSVRSSHRNAYVFRVSVRSWPVRSDAGTSVYVHDHWYCRGTTQMWVNLIRPTVTNNDFIVVFHVLEFLALYFFAL